MTDENFYFVMADRFQNGSAANDNGGLPPGKTEGQSGFDPTGKAWYHGGDLQGLQSRLGYIKSLGTTAIWLTPSFKNKAVQDNNGFPSAGYHGYWITDFTQIDPHLGTNDDLARADPPRARHGHEGLLRHHLQPHRRRHPLRGGRRAGLQVEGRVAVQDRRGHAVRRPRLRGREHVPGAGADGAALVRVTRSRRSASRTARACRTPSATSRCPPGSTTSSLYHNRGNTTFAGENSQYGDFFGLDDLFTENPKVVNGMIDIYKTWIRDFRIDGFRMDTMKHVDDAFWQKFAPAIERYAKSQGVRDFYMFGEVAEDTSRPITSHYMTHDDVQGVLDFPFQTAATRFAANSAPTSELGAFFRDDDWYTDGDSNVYNLPTFLGNHDKGRIGMFIRNANPGAAEAELLQRDRLAHALMYFSRGNPVVYYGDEQGFTGNGGDQDARQDMFPSQSPQYNNQDRRRRRPVTTAPGRTTTSGPTRRRWTTTSTRRIRSTAS